MKFYFSKVNSEFYPGWLDMWGLPHATVSTQSVIKTLVEQLDMKANVNFYMFHGGTNFGWSNGMKKPLLKHLTLLNKLLFSYRC